MNIPTQLRRMLRFHDLTNLQIGSSTTKECALNATRYTVKSRNTSHSNVPIVSTYMLDKPYRTLKQTTSQHHERHAHTIPFVVSQMSGLSVSSQNTKIEIQRLNISFTGHKLHPLISESCFTYQSRIPANLCYINDHLFTFASTRPRHFSCVVYRSSTICMPRSSKRRCSTMDRANCASITSMTIHECVVNIPVVATSQFCLWIACHWRCLTHVSFTFHLRILSLSVIHAKHCETSLETISVVQYNMLYNLRYTTCRPSVSSWRSILSYF